MAWAECYKGLLPQSFHSQLSCLWLLPYALGLRCFLPLSQPSPPLENDNNSPFCIHLTGPCTLVPFGRKPSETILNKRKLGVCLLLFQCTFWLASLFLSLEITPSYCEVSMGASVEGWHQWEHCLVDRMKRHREEGPWVMTSLRFCCRSFFCPCKGPDQVLGVW